MGRGMILLAALALVVAACGGDSVMSETSGDATTSTTAAAATTEAAVTTEARVPGAAFILQGESGPFVRALQFYLACAGHGPLSVDGVFGDATAAAVRQAQMTEGKVATGEPDEETFGLLARACAEERTVSFGPGETSARAAGNAAPGDDDVLVVRVIAGQEMTVVLDGDVDVAIQGDDGTVLHRPDGSAAVVVTIPTTQDYTLWVSSSAATSYLLTITIPAPEEESTTTTAAASGVVLAATGLGDLAFGTESGEAMDALVALFGDPVEQSEWETVEGYECSAVAMTATWELPAGGGFAATTLVVGFHDAGYSNPAFAWYHYRLTDHEDGSGAGQGELATAHGLSPGDTYAEAVGYGFVLGGFEEMSRGQLDGIDVWMYSDSGDYDADGYVGSIGAGHPACIEEL